MKRRIAVGVGVACVALLGLFILSARRTNSEPLSAKPKGVTVAVATATEFREQTRYIGTLEPWQEANVGPQMIAAYVDTVLVRPGATVNKGDVLATLDCRQAASGNSAIAAQARALEAKQKAVAGEAVRVQGLADKGFVSENEVDQRAAQTAAGEAQIDALRAQLVSKNLEVNDCVLRAPFKGEIAARLVDPGAFARPGTTIIRVVDRGLIRLVGSAPETDFTAVAPGTPVDIEILATNTRINGKIARRAPQADGRSRNIRFEIDLDNRDQAIPAGATAAIHVTAARSMPATQIPLTAATVRGANANVFVVDGGVAQSKSFRVIGERGGSLFVDPALSAGSQVVVEGRSRLSNGDRVDTMQDRQATAP